MKILKSLRREILTLDNYAEGRPPRISASGKCVKLASNENRFGSSPLALRAISEALGGGLSVYPDKKQAALKQAAANFWQSCGFDVTPEHIVFGDSSGEALNMLLAAFIRDKDTVVIPEKSFILYSLLARAKGAKVKEVRRREDQADPERILAVFKKTKKIRMIILANPDNPTSTYIPLEEIRKFLRRVPEQTAVLLDEAYIHFTGAQHSAVRLLRDFPNLIVLHTLSKAYGLAGLRVGYAVMHPKIAAHVEKIRLPFNLGTLQQVGALAAFSDREFLDMTVRKTADGREYLQRELGRLGIQHRPGFANFIFANLGAAAPAILKRLEDGGVSVRPLEDFGYEPGFVRITIGTAEENEYLVRLLEGPETQSA